MKRPETTYPVPTDPSEVVETFALRMHDFGIKRSVVLPDFLINFPMDPSPPDYHFDIARAFSHFMIDHFLEKNPEILATIYVDESHPDRMAELVDDLGSQKGIVGVLVPGLSPILPGDETWTPIFDAAQRKNLPICIHGVEYRAGELLGGFSNELCANSLSFPYTIVRQVTSIVMDGVPERFPRLKFVFMEAGVTWIPWLMCRLDDEYTERRYEAPLLRKLPSEYIKEFYFTQQPLETRHLDLLENAFRAFDAENHIIYASDYPHWDMDVPSVIYDLPFLSEAAKKKILGETSARLFKLLKWP